MASPKVMATTDEHLPEDIIVQILYRLPVKPLIRFRCNGLVFVLAGYFFDGYYICNPSTGLFLKLPNPGFASDEVASISGFHCGFGYVSATDDYKVVVAGHFRNSTMLVEMYSCKASSWKRIESQPLFCSEGYSIQPKGTFSNEALHWLAYPNTEDKPTIIAFDLVKEKFREMPLPLLKDDDGTNAFCSEMGVVSGGCLCVTSFDDELFCGYIQLWVMMDYDVCESWTKLVKLVHDQLHSPFVYWETSIVMFSYDVEKDSKVLVKFDHKEEEKLDRVAVCSGRIRLEVGDVDMIEYDESLLWLHDYEGAER